jgi:CheY-like chemotaxis protein
MRTSSLFEISATGITVGKRFGGVEAVLSRIAREAALRAETGVPVNGAQGPGTGDAGQPRVSGMATVLIVDDEFAIAGLLEMVLTDEGYCVVAAANGCQGLNRLAEGPRPDLVISDFMMPILAGAGLLRAMRESEAQRNIPCIVMSSMPEANVRERIGGYAAFVR